MARHCLVFQLPYLAHRIENIVYVTLFFVGIVLIWLSISTSEETSDYFQMLAH